MGRTDGQLKMIVMDLGELIPVNHLLKRIDSCVSFSFIYDLLSPYYSVVGRLSIDPVNMFKMLLVGYLYGIKSERRLVQEIQLNIAYRWFCGFDFADKIPDHSTFSKTRIRKWNESQLFSRVFIEIVRCCIEQGLVDSKEMVADGSYIPAQVARSSWIDTCQRLNCNKSAGKYLRCYQTQGDTCQRCPQKDTCFDKAGIRRRILSSSCYPAFHRGHEHVGSLEYWSMMKKRKIWAEGSFSVLKREHNLSAIRKQGIRAATEECLLSTLALNLKRLIKCCFLILKMENSHEIHLLAYGFSILSTGQEKCANRFAISFQNGVLQLHSTRDL